MQPSAPAGALKIARILKIAFPTYQSCTRRAAAEHWPLGRTSAHSHPEGERMRAEDIVALYLLLAVRMPAAALHKVR
jgi:hypothetical protein